MISVGITADEARVMLRLLGESDFVKWLRRIVEEPRPTSWHVEVPVSPPFDKTYLPIDEESDAKE